MGSDGTTDQSFYRKQTTRSTAKDTPGNLCKSNFITKRRERREMTSLIRKKIIIIILIIIITHFRFWERIEIRVLLFLLLSSSSLSISPLFLFSSVLCPLLFLYHHSEKSLLRRFDFTKSLTTLLCLLFLIEMREYRRAMVRFMRKKGIEQD